MALICPAGIISAMDTVKQSLERAQQHALDFLNQLDQQSVAYTADAATLRDRFSEPLPEQGSDPLAVIDHLVQGCEGGLLGSTGGRFFAWVIGGCLPSTLAADWLTTVWDQNAGIYACSPAASVVEEVAGGWIKELLDLPRSSSFALTTGCQMAHFTALSAARLAVLRDVGWNINEDGLFGAPPIRVITTEHRHKSLDRALRYLGIGSRSIIRLPTDEDGCVTPQALERELARDSGPTIVSLDAADLNIAAFDPFKLLIPIAKAVNAWVHIDGAFGLFARASRQTRSLTDGVELADSWAVDAHKWLNVPFDCGVAIVRDRQAHREAMDMTADYIESQQHGRDQISWNPEWSRRARGFTLYAALKEMGRSGVERIIDQCCRHAQRLVDEIGVLPGVEVVWRSELNQGLLRFLDSSPHASEADHDSRTIAVMDAINRSGEACFKGTVWNGRQAMRVSVVNWRTTDQDIDRTIRAVAQVLNEG